MRIAVLVLVIALATACGPAAEEEETPINPTAELTEVTGRIVAIDPPEGEIDSFTVDSETKEDVEVYIDPERDYGFDLNHLHEHLKTGDPVAVQLVIEDDGLYATSIEDV